MIKRMGGAGWRKGEKMRRDKRRDGVLNRMNKICGEMNKMGVIVIVFGHWSGRDAVVEGLYVGRQKAGGGGAGGLIFSGVKRWEERAGKSLHMGVGWRPLPGRSPLRQRE
jgi:hypothetical protein